ncbi:universal stress protein [Halopseudomonas salegens]|uniref:Nucleotide-binding universal stress protein, UspA family n=1 Tax=Halopseudomonas salegens TaxID=1434072 RepID=A0A1H2F1P6_9GAMM|nr:universal stress protein [Halopseudomonas salegens]SDU00878.1 Nucleotide-binding universal stress protein, UspA family [Halopseudomonas salegens]
MLNHLLLPIDLQHPSSWETALPTAISLARQNHARLTLLSVTPNFGTTLVAGYFPKDFAEETRKALHDRLQVFVENHLPADLQSDFLVADGKVWEAILGSADKLGVDLIIMASHKRPKLERMLLGTNAMRVVQQAPQSVMIVRTPR